MVKGNYFQKKYLDNAIEINVRQPEENMFSTTGSPRWPIPERITMDRTSMGLFEHKQRTAITIHEQKMS